MKETDWLFLPLFCVGDSVYPSDAKVRHFLLSTMIVTLAAKLPKRLLFSNLKKLHLNSYEIGHQKNGKTAVIYRNPALTKDVETSKFL